MIKKLRYYARFIVVCLLLNRVDMVKKLMEELTSLVDEYTKTFKPNDSAEWSVVLSEISTFLEAEKKLSPVDLQGNVLTVQSRLQHERAAKVDKEAASSRLKLQEAILVGNYQNQVILRFYLMKLFSCFLISIFPMQDQILRVDARHVPNASVFGT